MEATDMLGRNVRGKIVRWNNPVAVGRITSVRDALMGNVRVELQDGTRAMMLYPPLEVLD